ncbi:MAG: DUF6263 family protein [Ignavibacterium sp.]|nr:DUF6263 family protein [Ignavibacterium sp.]MCX7610203.1 DUF6263 family protein [Ignavibacterium sp.]MDW8375825.1 DUF6263 family protein [Ignavibacteriales bacterium]
MKKYFLVFFGIILFFFIACGDKKKSEPSKIDSTLYDYKKSELKTEPIDDKSVFNLSYRFDNEKNLLYRLVTISESEQKITADTIISNKLKQELVYLIEFKPKTKEADGTVEADVKIVGLKLNANFNGQNITFDSKDKNDTNKVKQFAEFASLVDNPFSIRFSKVGEISEIFRIDKIANSFFKLKNADTVDTETKNMVKEELSTNVLRPIAGQLIRKFTDKNLSKDSSWSIPQSPIPMMVYKINYTNKYKISSLEKFKDRKLAVIDAGIDFKVEGNNKYSDSGVDYVFSTPVYKGEGKIYFDISNGRIQRSHTKSSNSFSFTMTTNTPEGKKKAKREESNNITNILELID